MSLPLTGAGTSAGGGAAESVTLTDAINTFLANQAFAGSGANAVKTLVLDNYSIPGPVVYPWATLAGYGFGVVNDTVLQSVTFNALTSLAASGAGSGGIRLEGNTALTNVALPLLATINRGALTISGNTALASLNLTALTTNASGKLTISGNTALTSLNLSALVTMTTAFGLAEIYITDNTALASLNLSGLPDIDPNWIVTVTGNSLLTSVNLSGMVSCSGPLTMTGNAALASVTVPGTITLTNGFVMNLNGCALSTAAVDAILAACNAGLGSVTHGTLYLDGGTSHSPTGGAGNSDYNDLLNAGIDVAIN